MASRTDAFTSPTPSEEGEPREHTLGGPREPLLSTVKRRKLPWVGHITRHETVTKGTWKEDVVKVNKRKRIDW